MEKYKPKNYIEIRNVTEVNYGFEIRTTYFPHPVEYLNDKTVWQYSEESEERKNWASYCINSSHYRDVLNWCKYDSKNWKDQETYYHNLN